MGLAFYYIPSCQNTPSEMKTKAHIDNKRKPPNWSLQDKKLKVFDKN